MEWSRTLLYLSYIYIYCLVQVKCIDLKEWGLQQENALSDYMSEYDGLFNSAEMENILKEEIQMMRKDLTAIFVEGLSRKKRDAEIYDYEVVLEPLEYTYGAGVNSTFQSDEVTEEPVIFQDQILTLEKDGIYRIQARAPYNDSHYDNETLIVEKILLGRWDLTHPEDQFRVVAAIEKNDILFVLVCAESKGFSYLFTYSPLGSGIVLRQRIRNSGIVTSAKFFIFHGILYLVIIHDNEVHSITLCPLFKWMGTHMDEIHVIHARGASSVAMIEISSYMYIAIAQSVDAGGNKEVGTQILRMDRKSDLEKVQLLYSIHPKSLYFTKYLHEYILIIVQEKMPALVYFFGGYNFIFLQHLDTLKGSGVKLVSVLAPDGETYILASNGSQITTFARSTAMSRLTALMFVPYPQSTYDSPTNFRITGMAVRPPKYADDGTQDDRLIFSVKLASSDELYHQVEILTLFFQQVEKDTSEYKPPEEKLSKCLWNLQSSLADCEPSIQRLQQSNAVILRKGANTVYPGKLSSETTISADSETTQVENISIQPNINPDDKSTHSPSETKERIEMDINFIQDTIQPTFKQVFLRNQTNTVTGNLDFVNGVRVDNLIAEQIFTEDLNGISWQQLRTNVLRVDAGRPQIISGNWTFDEIQSESVSTAETISGKNISDILLTQAEPNTVQVVKGNIEFKEAVKFQDIGIPREKSINDIKIGEIINTTTGRTTVVKRNIQADKILIKSGTEVTRINEVNIREWYDSVLKIDGPEQETNGVYIFEGEFDAENVTVEKINGQHWDEFLESCLIDGMDQNIIGQTDFDHLDVEHFEAETINGIRVEDLLKRYANQSVRIPVHFDEVRVKGNTTNSRINGLDLAKDVVLYNQNAVINGPLNIHNLTVKSLKFGDGVRVGGVDIVKAEKARRTIIYKVKGDSNAKIFLKNIVAEEIVTDHVNDIPVSNFGNTYWTRSGYKSASWPFDLSQIPVTVTHGFKAEKINDVKTADYVKTSDNSPSASNEVINAPFYFNQPVFMHGHVNFLPPATLNNVNLEEVLPRIVHYHDSGVVYGTKTFKQPILANNGLRAGTINNLSVADDFVMLRNGWTSYVLEDLQFAGVYAEEIHVKEDTTIGGTLNGLNVTEIQENTVYADRSAVVESDVEFLQDVQADNLFVSGSINSYNIPYILERFIVLDNGNSTQYLYLNIDLLGNLDFYGPVEIETINGINPGQYFSSLSKRNVDQDLHGTKHFKGPVIIEGDLICKYHRINNISLLELEREAVSKTKDQTISGKIAFEELYANNINTATICGIPVSDFALIDNVNLEEISSPVLFTSGSKVLGDVKLNGTFNGYDINEIKDNLTHFPSGDRYFEKVKCSGNLTWKQDRRDVKGLSYLFNNAVRLNSSQPRTIKGHVTFQHGFSAKAITADDWINGVDLQRIKDDGAYKNQDANFIGHNTIPVMHIGHNGFLDPLEHLETDEVNGVNLTELNRDVVRQNQLEVVRGKKTFKNDVIAESIFTDDVNGCSVSDIAVNGDNRTIDSVTLANVEGIENLNFGHLNLFSWYEFLRDRVTLSSNQTITGDWGINGNVNANEFDTRTINGLSLADAVRKNSPTVQVIHGVKTIGYLATKGDLKADSINGRDIDTFCSIMVHKDRPEHFNQTVYLRGPVKFNKDIDIEGNFNNHNLNTVSDEFQEKLEYFKQNSTPSYALKQKTADLLEILADQLEQAAVWLDYLLLADDHYIDIDNPNRVEVAIVNEVARIAFSKLTPVTNNACGLPNGCLQNTIDMVEFGDHSYRQFHPIECQNIFEVSSSYNDGAYSIVSSVISYNTTCTSTAPASTQIYALTGSNTTNEEYLLGDITTGYITDAKTFHDHGTDYVVIAQFFGSSESEVGVYAISNYTIRKIQSIPTRGTIRIAMDHIHGRCFLGVANTQSEIPSPHFHEDPDYFDGDNEYSATYSEVYIWSRSSVSGNEHFILLREVATKNVLDLQFIEVYPNDHGFDRDSFIAFVHSENVVEIFRYDLARRNFFLFQTLAFDDEYLVTSLNSFYLKGSTYLIVSSLYQGLLIYQYKCIEGFKLYLEVPLQEVRDVTNFVLNKQIFFPIASSVPIIAQGKIQGPAFEY